MSKGYYVILMCYDNVVITIRYDGGKVAREGTVSGGFDDIGLSHVWEGPVQWMCGKSLLTMIPHLHPRWLG